MNQSNLVMITGNLGGDPEVVSASEKSRVVKFSIANNEVRFDDTARKWETTHTNWIRVTCFNHLAARALGGLKKGDAIEVKGMLRTSEYEKNNEKRYSFEVIASGLTRIAAVRGTDKDAETPDESAFN